MDRPYTPERNPIEQLYSAAEEYFEFYLAHPEYFRLLAFPAAPGRYAAGRIWHHGWPNRFSLGWRPDDLQRSAPELRELLRTATDVIALGLLTDQGRSSGPAAGVR
ncbi:hypothetical protein ACH474_03315 [Nocardia rhamnosiphila]|uniref:hypothetical protein n=1 Tax=Nocardia rhamnosiphila TaxID=426716 RepID=UPI00068C2E61|nr:hypothetical protein [Nocardia rhamnosiphila]